MQRMIQSDVRKIEFLFLTILNLILNLDISSYYRIINFSNLVNTAIGIYRTCVLTKVTKVENNKKD